MARFEFKDFAGDICTIEDGFIFFDLLSGDYFVLASATEQDWREFAQISGRELRREISCEDDQASRGVPTEQGSAVGHWFTLGKPK